VNPAHDVSAVDQYVEALPTSAGPAPTGRGGSKQQPLPTTIASKVREIGGDDAGTLMQVATSPAFGAPAGARLKPSQPRSVGDQAEAAQARPSALDVVVSPVAEANDSRLLFLLGLLAAMTAVAVTLTLRSQRREAFRDASS
jgi:hypothetical protein